jgi:hypothetical protein
MNEIESARKRKNIRNMLEDKKWALQETRSVDPTVVMLYVYDEAIGDVIGLFGLTHENLLRLKRSGSSGFTTQEVCDAAASYVYDYHMSEIRERPSCVIKMGPSMGLYMTHTKTFEGLMEKDKGGNKHFVIIIYSDKTIDNITFRPIGFINETSLHSIDDIKFLVTPYIERDKVENANFFPSCPVVPIR